jgi:hypothetical protein
MSEKYRFVGGLAIRDEMATGLSVPTPHPTTLAHASLRGIHFYPWPNSSA